MKGYNKWVYDMQETYEGVYNKWVYDIQETYKGVYNRVGVVFATHNIIPIITPITPNLW